MTAIINSIHEMKLQVLNESILYEERVSCFEDLTRVKQIENGGGHDALVLLCCSMCKNFDRMQKIHNVIKWKFYRAIKSNSIITQ